MYVNKIFSILGKEFPLKNLLSECKYLVNTGDSFNLKKRHSYYGQIQLGMAILNLKSCDFIVYSSFDKQLIVIDVPLDVEFAEKLILQLKKKIL